MITPFIVIFSALAYVALMFAIAYYVERKFAQGVNLTNNAFIYTLALTTYLTTWMFYGNVGLAATKGYYFLAPYIGNTLFCFFWWGVLRRLIRIKTEYNITSIADFISVRYDKSSLIAALVTIMTLIGIVPYLALQLIAVFNSYALITTGTSSAVGGIQSAHLIILGLVIFFTIIFGFRRLDQAERHPGVIMVTAVQSIVKFVAFFSVGIFVTYFMYDGFGDLFSKMSASSILPTLQTDPSYGQWVSYLVVSIFAILVLPRQFYAGVVENTSEKHVRTAMWLFPVILLLNNFFVYPIAIGGILGGYDVKIADTFTLLLPLKQGNVLLSLLVFIGGLSAAMSMIILSAITLTSMAANHLVVPVIERVKLFNFLRTRLLFLRWFMVGIGLCLSYWFALAIGSTYILVKIGILSFEAIFQFVPVFLGALYWKKGNKYGAIMGLSAGFLVWIYTALVPALVRSGWMPKTLLSDGPFGLHFLRPENLFGITLLDPVSLTLLFTFVFNGGLYLIGSFFFAQSEEEQQIAYRYSTILKKQHVDIVVANVGDLQSDVSEKVIILNKVFGAYMSMQNAATITELCINEARLLGKSRVTVPELMTLYNVAEKRFAGYVGVASAKEALLQGGLFTESEVAALSDLHRQFVGEKQPLSGVSDKKTDHHAEMEKFLKEQHDELEKVVSERTKKLEEANLELKRINEFTVGRELRMVELKEKIKQLEGEVSALKDKTAH